MLVLQLTLLGGSFKMKLQDLSKDVFYAVEMNKRISRVGITEGDLRNYLGTIDHINGLAEDDHNVMWHHVSMYKIPKGWNGLIMPTKVSLGGHKRNPDILNRPTLDPNFKPLAPSEFNLITDSLLGSARNHGQEVAVERPARKAFNADANYLINGRYINNEVSIGMLDLDQDVIESVLYVSSHVEDVKLELARQMGKALANGEQTAVNM